VIGGVSQLANETAPKEKGGLTKRTTKEKTAVSGSCLPFVDVQKESYWRA